MQDSLDNNNELEVLFEIVLYTVQYSRARSQNNE
jgi:hypothetical protein